MGVERSVALFSLVWAFACFYALGSFSLRSSLSDSEPGEVERSGRLLQVNIFAGPDVYTTQKSRDGKLSYLDRQKLDCDDEVMNGFQMITSNSTRAGSISFTYRCIREETSKAITKTSDLKSYPTSPNKGIDGLGSLEVQCPVNTVMTKWAGSTEAGKFTINYTCKTYNLAQYLCKDRVTSYADVGPPSTLMYLDRQKVQCGEEEALRGWNGQISNSQLRIHYTCCAAVSHNPTAHPSHPPTAEPTTKPTMEPTFVPTAEPTTAPTYAPSAHGTISPTHHETLKPTPAPSTAPTIQPTIEPTVHPSTEPTFEPTEVPSTEPLAAPSPSPSFEPTPNPTVEPTLTFRPTTLQPTIAPAAATNEPTGIHYKPADLCGFVYSKEKSKAPPKGCALFAKHNIEWLNDEQGSPAIFACASVDEEVKITEEDLRTHGLLTKDDTTMLTTIIPGPGTIVTFFSEDKFTGKQHTFTEESHKELSKFHFAGADGQTLKLEREHAKSAIVKSAASAKTLGKYPSGWCHN